MLDDDNNNSTLSTVAWLGICPWLAIFRTFRMAISFRVLLLAAVGIFVTLSGWALFGIMFSVDDRPTVSWMSPMGGCPWLAIDAAVDNAPRLPDTAELQEVFLQPTTDDGMPGNPFYGTWLQLSRPLVHTFDPRTTISPDAKTTISDLACLALCGLWAVATWAFFGAAISRMAAVQLAADERIGWGAALRFACSKWRAYFAAPLLPVLGILIAAAPAWVLGWIMRAPVGVLLAAIGWPLLLLLGLLITVLLLMLLFGWPLMWATVSTEGTDSFDALQRSYSYVSQRPLHYLFYAVVAAVFGGLGWLLVKNFAAGVVGLTYWAAGWSCGAVTVAEIEVPRISQIVAGGEALGGIGGAGAALIWFWVVCVKLLAVGFIYGYFWTASTAIYLLLRRDTDATEMDEVFLDEDAGEPTYGLPPLKADEAGAPMVDEEVPEVEPDDEEPPTGQIDGEPQREE